jgi:hypothetical protein
MCQQVHTADAKLQNSMEQYLLILHSAPSAPEVEQTRSWFSADLRALMNRLPVNITKSQYGEDVHLSQNFGSV